MHFPAEFFPENAHQVLDELLQMNTNLPGLIQQKILRFKAFSLLDKPEEELNMIVHLVESHSPGFKLRADIEHDSKAYEGLFLEESTKTDILNLFLRDKFTTESLMNKLAELPKEWTVIQITPQYSGKDIFALNADDLTLGGVHFSVFNCGNKNDEPFCISLPGGNAYSLSGDMRRLKKKLKEIYSIPQAKVSEDKIKKLKKIYHKKRLEMEDTIENFLLEIEEKWLRAWKCLFIGKYEDDSLEMNFHQLVKKFLETVSIKNVSNKVQKILVQAVKQNTFLEIDMMDEHNTTVLQYCFPGQNLENQWKSFWEKQNIEHRSLHRHPIILIVDEALDAFPWEMIYTLNSQPASRMPSLHLLYAHYKAHETTIVDGFKIIPNSKNGRFILNPGMDLKLMEKRLKSFFHYWLPEWIGLTGKTPNSQDFLNALTSSDVFCYSGHGSGGQYISSEKILKSKIDSIVLLFGCGSSQLIELGPCIETYGNSLMYSLAGCPCLIGMLWIVTDVDTDVLTTQLLSTWIPNVKVKPWQLMKQKEWIDQGTIVLDEVLEAKRFNIKNEPNLLRALCIAKNKMKYFCNRAAVVARGIPVKMSTS